MSRAETEREKLLNAIIFFTKNTRGCHQLKLFKLLFLLDFSMYRATGRTTTGLQYFAWPMGPVPRDLLEEIKAPGDDMRSTLAFKEAAEADPDFNGKQLTILPRRSFDDGCFTPRELAEMARLAEVYRDATGAQMRDVTHHPGTQAAIPYKLALDEKPGSISKEQAESIEEEARELAALFK